jgi:hypothetical protein
VPLGASLLIAPEADVGRESPNTAAITTHYASKMKAFRRGRIMNYDNERDNFQNPRSDLYRRLECRKQRARTLGIILPILFLVLYFTVDMMGVLSASTMSAIAVLAIIFMMSSN